MDERFKKSCDSRGKPNKEERSPVGQQKTALKMDMDEKVRIAIGQNTRLDASYYERQPEYKGMTFFWENDTNGAVERWLHIGASLTKRTSKILKKFKGFTDRSESEWECVPVGSDTTGQAMMAYLLYLPEEEYHALRIAPKEKRNREILDALGMGKAQVDSQVMPSTTGIKTYAPNNRVGTGKGFEQLHDA